MMESNNGQTTSLSPFPLGYRASGVLLHVTSLPSPYGIGDVGPAARAWIDRLHEAGQTWWQSLPLGPTGYGNSPYQPLSSFAGNLLLISPEDLVADGLLRTSDTAGPSFSKTDVDYDAVIAFKDGLLQKVWANFRGGARRELKRDYEQFRVDQAHWLNDYALFRSLKARFAGASYLEWPAEFVWQSSAAMARARRELAAQIDQVCLAQFLLFRLHVLT
jgi:4-alpha-glucanotransferase